MRPYVREYTGVRVYKCMMCSCLCVSMRAPELLGLKYSTNQHCSSCQFPSLLTIRIPRRSATKTGLSNMQIPVRIQKPMPYLDTAVRIQKPEGADVSEPSRPSFAADFSPADEVARNGIDGCI